MNVLVSTEFMDFMMNVSTQNFKLKKKSGRKLLVLDTHTHSYQYQHSYDTIYL